MAEDRKDKKMKAPMIAAFIDFFLFDYRREWTAPDPDGAAIALGKAGYTAAKVPRRLLSQYTDEGDDFMYAVISDASDFDTKVVSAIWDEINAIVRPYGGEVADLCPIERDLPSLEVLFEERLECNSVKVQ